jgi:hypothetical protein
MWVIGIAAQYREFASPKEPFCTKNNQLWIDPIIEIKERDLLKLCFYVYFYTRGFLWIKPRGPLTAWCTENQKSVLMYSGGFWISQIKLWVTGSLMHRPSYRQFSSMLINRAEGGFSTGLTRHV